MLYHENEKTNAIPRSGLSHSDIQHNESLMSVEKLTHEVMRNWDRKLRGVKMISALQQWKNLFHKHHENINEFVRNNVLNINKN